MFVGGFSKPTSRDVFEAQVHTLGLDLKTFSTGRLGHGLGLQLTESFSINSVDNLPFTPGVVFTIEPGMLVEGSEDKLIVHEENAVITETGCEW